MNWWTLGTALVASLVLFSKRRNLNRNETQTIWKSDRKREDTTLFLLAGKLPLDFTIMVHNLTSSGWVHLSCNRNSCVRPGEGTTSKPRLKGLSKNRQTNNSGCEVRYDEIFLFFGGVSGKGKVLFRNNRIFQLIWRN